MLSRSRTRGGRDVDAPSAEAAVAADTEFVGEPGVDGATPLVVVP